MNAIGKKLWLQTLVIIPQILESFRLRSWYLEFHKSCNLTTLCDAQIVDSGLVHGIFLQFIFKIKLNNIY